MCGIVGRWNRHGLELPLGMLAAMTRSLRHRGPDDQGLVLFRKDPRTGWKSESFSCLESGPSDAAIGGFGHTRLSVIDLSPRGRQPMCNEDGSVWITYNGEIYNFESLRDELTRHDHRFRSDTDTEVILHGYEQWGVSCLERLNGMFAFCLFDGARSRLLLARDRLGIKPLYYHHGNDCFAFASEPKALFQCEDIPRMISLEAIKDYLTLGYTPAPKSFFRQIQKLSPGHFLVVDLHPHSGRPASKPRITAYWDTRFEQARRVMDEEECVRELQRLLGDSVRMRLVGDVPLGAFLSGGVDSSAIVSFMSRFSKRTVKTFSIGFPEPMYNEVAFAREVACHFGTEHEEKVLPPGVHGDLAEVLHFFDEPLADTSILPTYRLSRFAREKVTVCLSGDGGDELFGGYYQHDLVDRILRIRQVPIPLRFPLAWLQVRGFFNHPWVRGRLSPIIGLTARECIGVVGSWSEELAREILRPSLLRILEEHCPYQILDRYYLRSFRATPLDRIQYVDLKTYLPEDILTKVDRASMAVGLEVRVPFLDHRVVEFVAGLPTDYRVRAGKQKYVLKKAFEGVLPQSVLERPKQGFAIPEAPWLQNEILFGHVRRLSEQGSHAFRLILPEKVAYLLKTFERHNPYPSRLIWALLILEEWFMLMEKNGGVVFPDELI